MSDKALTLSLARLPRALGSTLREDIVWVAPDDPGNPLHVGDARNPH